MNFLLKLGLLRIYCILVVLAFLSLFLPNDPGLLWVGFIRLILILPVIGIPFFYWINSFEKIFDDYHRNGAMYVWFRNGKWDDEKKQYTYPHEENESKK